MKVKFTDEASAGYVMSIMESYPDAIDSGIDLDRHYEGDVIGTTSDFWGGKYLIVACDDGNVRECLISKAKILQE